MFKLAIVGSRDYCDYDNFKIHVDQYITSIGIILEEIVSGGAKGADSLAERYAKEHGIKMVIYEPDWESYGKKAGIMRNTDIINHATHVIAFPFIYIRTFLGHLA